LSSVTSFRYDYDPLSEPRATPILPSGLFILFFDCGKKIRRVEELSGDFLNPKVSGAS
jgi:hypothetical protein